MTGEEAVSPDIRIASRNIGPSHPVFIIAEAGVNHNGDLEVAKTLVREARRCGADCVKFQTFKAERVVTRASPKAEYQLRTTNPAESQIAMLQKLELDQKGYAALIDVCEQEQIIFLSTPYGREDVDFLSDLGVPAFKVASGQVVEPAFLRHVAQKKRPVILSTGMATLVEVEEAVRVIRNAGNDQVIVLQCTTNYPSRPQDANVRAMKTMESALCVHVGYSDHTQTETACIAAVALGARVIEKHFTLDKDMQGPDHSSSADPAEFRQLVKVIRETEAVLGSGIKEPVEVEKRNMVGMRRSLVSSVDIPSGAVITEEMLTCKRPGTGIAPNRLHEIIGRIAATDIPQDSLIAVEQLK